MYSIEIVAGDPKRACTSCYEHFKHPEDRAATVTEAEALMAFFVSFDGLNWKNNSGWASQPSDMEGKYGVTLSQSSDVSMIILTENNLVGMIPDSIRNFSRLTKLSLSKNSLFGPISRGLSHLSQLICLQLSHNKLSGKIPGFLGNIKLLQRLDLSHNKFYGSIPDELGFLTELRWLHLDNNQIHGILPPDISNLTNLKSLTLSNNNMDESKASIVNKIPRDCIIMMDEPSACSVS